MCTEYSMLRKIAIWDCYRQILQPIWSTTKDCVQMHISNDKWLITTTRIFYKNSSASLDCVTISELCSAIDSTVAILFMKTSLHSIKLKHSNLAGCNIWNSLHETNGKYENLNSVKSHLHYYHTAYYRCSYVVNSVHEYFAVTDSHLQISQHQACLKHDKLHRVISQLHHITTTKHCAATATF